MQDYLDQQDWSDHKKQLRTLAELTSRYGLETALNVAELVLKLSEARKQGSLEKLVKELQKQDLLILDEWGYVLIDRDGSQMLFRIISDSYERKSLILTTNLEFSKSDSVFTDE